MVSAKLSTLGDNGAVSFPVIMPTNQELRQKKSLWEGVRLRHFFCENPIRFELGYGKKKKSFGNESFLTQVLYRIKKLLAMDAL